MSSKRAPKNINANGSKKKKVITFSVDSHTPFVYTENMLTVTIFGRPQSYKRTGGNHGIRYDQQKEIKAEFVRALSSLYKEHRVKPMSFGQDDIEVNATFVFERKNGRILNDVDNLSKFLLDCLQLQHNKISLCDNDNQVIRLCVEKKYGDVAFTKFTVVRASGSSSSDSSNIDIHANICNSGGDNDSAIDLTGSAESCAQPRVEI